MSFFEVFAESAIAFTGLGAIHSVLAGGSSPRGAVRALLIVMLGGLAFLLSILPLILDMLALSSVALWRMASAAGFLGCGGALLLVQRLSVRFNALGYPPQAPWMLRSAYLMGTAATLAMLVNLAGWPWPPGPVLYAIAVSLILTEGLVALLHSFWIPVGLALEETPED
ncbi:MAG: hypothetical protein ACC682_13535 [Gemmatimonadota bacterium]